MGLHQGDPLSHSCLSLLEEALSRMFSMAADAKLIGGFRFVSGGPTITLLQFVDDTLIFL